MYWVHTYRRPSTNAHILTHGFNSVDMHTMGTSMPTTRLSFSSGSTLGFDVGIGSVTTSDIPTSCSIVLNMHFPYGWNLPYSIATPPNTGNVPGSSDANWGGNVRGSSNAPWYSNVIGKQFSSI